MENLGNVRGVMQSLDVVIQAFLYAFTVVFVLAFFDWINKITDKK